jgi:hypothetical protein
MDSRIRKYDLILKDGMLVTGKGFTHCSVGILNGKIESIGEEVRNGEAKEVIDASGMYVLPGFVDAHTHPYYEDDFTSLPQIAAFGGTTTVIHYAYAFPGDSVRQALDKAFESAGSSCIDYAFHLGLFEVEKQYADIPHAFPYGVKSFKMFMTYAKLGRMTNDYYLAAAMDLVAEHGGMVMVHAENGLANRLPGRQVSESGNPRPGFLPKSSALDSGGGSDQPGHLDCQGLRLSDLYPPHQYRPRDGSHSAGKRRRAHGVCRNLSPIPSSYGGGFLQVGPPSENRSTPPNKGRQSSPMGESEAR